MYGWILIINYSILNVFKDEEWTPRPHKVKLAHSDEGLPIYIRHIQEMEYVAG